jgi:hypothetical protein
MARSYTWDRETMMGNIARRRWIGGKQLAAGHTSKDGLARYMYLRMLVAA